MLWLCRTMTAQEPLTTCRESWGICHSLPSVSPGVVTGCQLTFQANRLTRYCVFYLSAVASVKNGSIYCCCSSCLAIGFGKYYKEQTGLLILIQITRSEVNGPSVSLLYSVYFSLSSFLWGQFDGQKRVFSAASHGLLVTAAATDLGFEVCATAVLI